MKRKKFSLFFFILKGEQDMEMDIITFVEDVLGMRLIDGQKEYLKRMYDIYKDDRDVILVTSRGGRFSNAPTLLALGLYESFKRYESKLEPYQRYELMHLRKKPRGSIRRNRR